jgi:hypothetical protein
LPLAKLKSNIKASPTDLAAPRSSRRGRGRVQSRPCQIGARASRSVSSRPRIAHSELCGRERRAPDGLIVSGSVGIGTSTVASGDKLSVAGNIKATGSITADGGIKVKTWSMEVPDYVFETGHHPMSLSEVEAFVNTNKHLPEVPSAATMRRQGMDLVEMNLILLKKVEELTIYMIQQDKKLAALQSQQSK